MANILVVDDHRDGRDFLTTLLGYRGHKVTVAVNGEQALRVIQDVAPDLVVSDVLMPKVDGYELVRQMREDPRVASTPVIFYTAAYEDETARTLAHSVGVIQFLQKPADPRVILGIIDAALGTAQPTELGGPPATFEQDHRALLTTSLTRRVEELQAEIAERKRIEAQRVLAEDALQQSQRRQKLMFDLMWDQRQATDEGAVMTAAAGAIGTFLGADRTSFCEIDDAGILSFPAQWATERLAAIAVAFPVAAIGGKTRDMFEVGSAYIFSDLADESPDPAFLGVLGIVANIGIAVMRERRCLQGFFVSQAEPRRWSMDEVSLAREVAEVTWNAVERLRTLRALEERQAPARTWELNPDIHCVLNQQGFFERTNPAWQRVLGWTHAEIASVPFLDLVHPDDVERTREAYETTMASGRPVLRYENRYRHSNGSFRWLSWVAIPECGRIYCTARDVTADKEAASELLQLQDALRQSQKMEAVGQLTGGLAHDFNNLLAGISGALELMQVRITQGRLKDVDRYMIAAQGASRRAAALTHRLLAFSRRQTLDPKTTDVNRLVTGMEDLIRRTVGPTIAIEAVGSSGLWTALVDPPQLENALLNLCINARDAMPDGGRITIETANKWLDDHAARLHDMPPGQYLSLCVTDNGSGMPPDVIAHVFEPFFTTKPIGEGTGLGLSMIYGFAKQSGGQVRIYSEVGQGTTVCIYLPRHLGVLADDAAALGCAKLARAAQGETVLVVDDEPTVRMLVTDVLEELGYTAIEAADSLAGLKVLQSDVRIDLLVTDVGLPGGMNGRQMADAARIARSALKVLFITGYAENAVVSNGHLDPGMQVMTKPFAMEALAARIKEMILA